MWRKVIKAWFGRPIRLGLIPRFFFLLTATTDGDVADIELLWGFRKVMDAVKRFWFLAALLWSAKVPEG